MYLNVFNLCLVIKKFKKKLFILIVSADAMSYKEIEDNKKVCSTYPISSKMFSELYEIESRRSNTPLIGPPKIPIKWTSYISGKTYNLCANNTKQSNNIIVLDLFKSPQTLDMDDTTLYYSCVNDQLCLHNSKHNYPGDFTCVLPFKSLRTKLNMLVNYKLSVGEMYERYIGIKP